MVIHKKEQKVIIYDTCGLIITYWRTGSFYLPKSLYNEGIHVVTAGVIDELSNLNSNSIIIIDSDYKDNEIQKLKPNAKRIQKEFEKKGKFVWITGGREIENYIHPEVLKEAVKVSHPDSADFIIGSSQFGKMVNKKFLKTKTAKAVVKIYEEKASYKYNLWGLDKKLAKLIDEIKKAGNSL